MKDFETNPEELLHLVRIGASGDARQFGSLARRMGRRLKRDGSPVGEEILRTIEAAGANGANALRRASKPAPSDPDTRQLLLFEGRADVHAVQPALPMDILASIDQLVLEQEQRTKLERAGLRSARTGLFVGPPGVGKTMTAHWIAARLNRPLHTLDLASTSSAMLGRTGGNIRDAMAFAREAPCVLLLDEFDALAKRRGDEDIGEAKRVVTVLLQEIDRWPSTSLLLAATNHGELLDRAIWRRFDVMIEFPVASKETARSAALAALAKDADDRLAALVAGPMKGRSLSDVAAIILAARKRAFLYGTDLEQALLEQVGKLAKALPRKEAQTIALGLIEAGHSQRRASDLTGVSRDTLRKKTGETGNE